MEPLLDKLARNKSGRKYFIRSLWSIVIAGIWLFATAFCDLSTDDGNAKFHPWLDAAAHIMTFPITYLPGMDSFAGLVLNCLLWGFFIVWAAVWACRFIVRRLTAKGKARQKP